MGFLSGKRILITGLLSNRSIAYGIAQACKREGAELAFTYVGDRFRERITEFAAEFGSTLVYPCDVGDDAQIDALFHNLKPHWDGLDGLVHSIGFAPREAIAGDFLDGLSREAFRVAHDISAYSFPALAKADASGKLTAQALSTSGQTELASGLLEVIDNQVDQQTGTIRLKANFPNDKRQLWPGQFVNVRVLVDTLKNVVVAPTEAIQRGPDGDYVYVVQADKTVSMRPVKISRQDEKQAVIAEGVKPGEMVSLSWQTTGATKVTLTRQGLGELVTETDPGKVADEARFDGIFILRTNARITPLQAVLRYRDLLQVEDLFRTAKALLRTRPIYHASDAAIRGHVFCSFLALVLKKELDDRCHAVGFRPEWGDVLRDLDRLQEVELAKDGKRMILRTPVTGTTGRLFQAARVALPANLRDADRAA